MNGKIERDESCRELGGATAPGEATAEDYQAALSEFGVKI